MLSSYKVAQWRGFFPQVLFRSLLVVSDCFGKESPFDLSPLSSYCVRRLLRQVSRTYPIKDISIWHVQFSLSTNSSHAWTERGKGKQWITTDCRRWPSIARITECAVFIWCAEHEQRDTTVLAVGLVSTVSWRRIAPVVCEHNASFSEIESLSVTFARWETPLEAVARTFCNEPRGLVLAFLLWYEVRCKSTYLHTTIVK